MFALKRTSLGSVLDCVALCLEESLLSLAKLRLEEVWKSFTEHTKRVDVWLKNDSEKVRNSLTWFSHGSGASLSSRAFGESSFFYYKSV